MLIRQSSDRRRRSAFTLMEMLVVVAIIVALAAVGGFFLLGQLEGAKKDAAALQVKTLTKACEAYYTKHGKFPDNLKVLTVPDEYKTVYIDDPEALIDPWKRGEYTYDAAGNKNGGTKPDISTTAPDGTLIGNWPKGR